VFRSRLSRRRLLCGLAAASVLATAGCAKINTPTPAPPTKLQFLDSDFDATNTNALLSEFRARNPHIAVERTVVSSDRVVTDLIASVASGTGQDVTFVPGGALARLSADGWLRDLSGRPGANALDAAELPWANAQTTVSGGRYGVLSWVRLHGFFYNHAYLTTVGVAPPTTFDDLRTVAQAIEWQRLGNYAFYWPLKNGPGVFADDYLAAGMPMFDARLNPRFASDPVYSDVLAWRLNAIYKWNLVDPRGLENQRDQDQSFPHGWAAFSWDTYDRLRLWQVSGQYLQSGHLANALVPSWTTKQEAIGAADLWGMPSTVQQGDFAWELLYYLTAGENYRAARARWRESGLLFGYSALVSDRALLTDGANWANVDVLQAQLAQVCAPPGISCAWQAEWLSYATIQSALLIRRLISPTTFTTEVAREWTALSARVGPSSP